MDTGEEDLDVGKRLRLDLGGTDIGKQIGPGKGEGDYGGP